eukprot:UN10573
MNQSSNQLSFQNNFCNKASMLFFVLFTGKFLPVSNSNMRFKVCIER